MLQKRQLLLLVVFYVFPLFAFTQSVIKGRVFTPDDGPLANVSVLLTPTDRGAVSSAEGEFRFEELEPGKYVLQLSYLGYQFKEETVWLEADEVREMRLTMVPSAFTLDEMVVRSTRSVENTPMTYTNLSKSDIEEQNLGVDVPYLLRWSPSAIVTSDAGAGIGYTGIRIRGTDPTRINVTINGIPLNDAESQGVFWVNMPDFASSTESIQVQRGVGSSSNGAGAFGATINLNTSRVREQAYAGINTSVGSFNTFKRNVRLGTGLLNDKFTIDGRLSRITSDGYIDRAISDLDSYYLSAAFVGEKSLLRFNTFAGHEITYQAWNGVPADLIDDRDTRTFNSAGTEKPGEPYENEVDNYRQAHYQLIYNQQLSGFTNANISLHYTKGSGFFEQYKADQDLASYGLPIPEEGISPDLVRRLWLDNDFYGAVYALQHQKNRVDLTLGGGYNIYEGGHFGEVIWSEFALGFDPEQPYYDNDARKTDFNIYGKLSYTLQPGLSTYLDLQWRRIGYEFLGFDLNGNNVTQTDDLSFFNPKVGLFYEISPASDAYLSLAVANREPNRNDYVESTPASRPRPERLYDLEAGYNWSGKRGRLEATLYYMYYQDQLALNGQINDVGAFTRTNIPESYRLGLELAAGFQVLDQLALEPGLTLSRNKVTSFTEFVDVYTSDGGYDQVQVEHENTDLSFSPSVLASIGLVFQPLKGLEGMENYDLEFSLLNKYVGQQYIDNTSDPDNVLDPYFFTDLRVNFRLHEWLGREIGVTFLVQNVFDALYETNAWSYRYRFDGTPLLDQGFYPQAGRNYLLGLNVGF